MKKILTMALVMVTFFILVACDGESQASSIQTTESQTEITTIQENALEERLSYIYQLAVENDDFDGTYEEWLESVRGPRGEPGREVTFQVDDGFIQWQYTGEDNWENLLAIEDLSGPSLFDLYRTIYPGYQGNEREWLYDLVNDRLIEEDMWTVSFDSTGGTLVDPMLVEDGDSIANLPRPTREGYIFKGWFTGNRVNDGQFTVLSIVTRDLNLYAQWEYDEENAVEPEYDYYVTGNFAGWDETFGDPEYHFQMTHIDDPNISTLRDQLISADNIYTVDIQIPDESAGWDFSYTIDGSEVVFDGNLTIKFAKTETIYGDAIPMWWAPSPESGQVYNLTPETLFMPSYVDSNSDDYIEGLGDWNSNPVVYEPGIYRIVLSEIDGSLYLGAILLESYVDGPNTNGITEDSILVGNTTPVTGVFASVGYPFNQALQATFEAFNSAGGIGGRTIDFITYNDEFNASQGITYTHNLVEDDEIFALVGHFGSGTVEGTIDYIQEQGVPMVYAATGINDLYFHESLANPIMPVQPTYFIDGRIMAARALTTLTYGENHDQAFPEQGKIAVVYSNDDPGESLKAGVEFELNLLGVDESNIAFISTTSETISSGMADVSFNQVDVVILAMNQTVFPSAIAQMAYQNIEVPVFTSYMNASVTLLDPSHYSEDRPIYTNAWMDTTSENGTDDLLEYQNMIMNSSFLSESEKSNYLYNSYAIAGYMAAKVFIEGLIRVEENGDDLNRENYIKAMEQEPVDIPMGDIVDFTSGKRWGVSSMALLKYDVGDNPNTTDIIETDYAMFEKVIDFENIEALEAMIPSE